MYCFKHSSDTIPAQFATMDAKTCFALYQGSFPQVEDAFQGLGLLDPTLQRRGLRGHPYPCSPFH